MKILSSLLHPKDILATNVDLTLPVSSVTQSSDAVTPGSLFFAVRGVNLDGHSFVPLALEKGAVAVVVESQSAFAAAERAIWVRSTREALGLVAARWAGQPTERFHLVGVTGTNGKTTTTYLLKSVWEALGLIPGIVGTVETHIGTSREPATLTTPDPLVLQNLFSKMASAGVTHAAIEVSSIALDQSRVAGSRFEVGVFTNLTRDHLDYHKSFENYYLAKRRLFTDYGLRSAVFNIDDEWGLRLARECKGMRRLTFAIQDPAADFWVAEADFGKQGTTARMKTPMGVLELRIPLIGKHNVYNCLGVCAVSFALGHDLRKVVEALARASGAPGRLERVENSQERHIFVDYAHSDDALKNVLESLVELRRGSQSRILTVFGCGGDRDRTKRPKMADVASSLSDVTIVTSDNPRTEDPEKIVDEIEPGIHRQKTEFHREVNRTRAIHLALTLAKPGDIVLIAGKGHETYQIIGKQSFPFDDREVVRDFYRNQGPT